MKIICDSHLTQTQRKYITLAFNNHKEHLLAGGGLKINRFEVYSNVIRWNEKDGYGKTIKRGTRFEVTGA